MIHKSISSQVLISFAILFFMVVGTVLVVLYGMGYRFGLDEQGRVEIAGTGLLVATSVPDGASVYINDNLTTATDNTINLAPGEYKIKITKEGYFPWEKTIQVQKEVVSKADALLFPVAPKLESITANGVQNPVIDPSLTKIAFTVASGSARKNGIYILDMSQRPILTLQSSSTQIADDTIAPFSESMLTWSPDGQELIASFSAENELPTTYLLRTSGFNDEPSNITATLDSVLAVWNTEKQDKEVARINALKKDLRAQINKLFTIVAWSPDDTKILYIASESATLPVIIKPRLVGVDNTPEQRNLEKGKLYVYDSREDKNFQLPVDLTNPEQPEKLPIYWFPDSEHLLFVKDRKITAVEYDGNNGTILYAGPFINGFVFPWTNTEKMVILTDLGNEAITPNLYTISLK